MRTVAYAAIALAAGAQAFAPVPMAGMARKGAMSLRMSEDPAAVMARVNAMLSGKPVEAVAASIESSYKAPAAAPAANYENPDDVMARVNAMMSGAPAPAARAAAPAYSAPAPQAAPREDAASIMARVNAQSGGAPAPQPTSSWRWSGKDTGGYNPRARGGRAPSSAGAGPSYAAAPAAAAGPSY